MPTSGCNRWLLYTALVWGIGKVHFICLWNGARRGPGGTRVCATGGQARRQVHWIPIPDNSDAQVAPNAYGIMPTGRAAATGHRNAKRKVTATNQCAGAKKILACDGGGILGMMSVEILAPSNGTCAG